MAEKLEINVLAKALGINSLKDLQAGFQMVGAVVGKLKDGVKDVTEAFIEQEKQENQLNAVLKSTGGAAGLSAKEIKNMAISLQEQTTFGDEAILSAQNLILTFTKIGKDVFPSATETVLNMSQAMGQDLKSSSIQLGKALNDPINGISSLSRVGIQFTEDQKNMIKEMQNAGNIAEAQKIILKELETQFGGSAKAARDTFGGALESLENTTGDTKEILGSFVAVAGKDIVNAMNESSKSLNAFLSSAKNMEKVGEIAGKIAGAFMMLKDIATTLGKEVFKTLSSIVSNIKDNFQKLSEEGEKSISIFDIFAGILKTVSIVLSAAGKYINTLITYWVDWIVIVKESIQVATGFFQALAGKKNWGDVWDSIKDTGKAFKSMALNVKDNVADLITSTIDEFKKLPGETKNLANKIENSYTETYKKINGIIKKTTDITIKEEKKKTDIIKEEEEKRAALIKEEEEKKAALIEKLDKEIFNTTINAYNKIADAVVEIYNFITDIIKNSLEMIINETQKAEAKQIEIIENSYSMMTENAIEYYEQQKELLEEQNDFLKEKYEERLEALSEQQESELEFLSEKQNSELEMLEEHFNLKKELIKNEGMTKEAALNKELKDIKSKLLIETDEDTKAKMLKESKEIEQKLLLLNLEKKQKEELKKLREQQAQEEEALRKEQAEKEKKLKEEKEKALKEQLLQEKKEELKQAKILEEINEKKEKQIQEAKEKFAKKEHALKVQQFNANKGMQIAQLWIQYALGIVSLWANAMQLGPIAGPIAAGIMTGVLTGITAANTAVIASQQAPALAEGGNIKRGGMAIVGERGPEMVALPTGATVFSNKESQGMMGETTNIYIDRLIIQEANNIETIIEELEEIKRTERSRR